jgi:hypothetical protein
MPSSRDIQPDEWTDFLHDFCRRHESWLVDVDSFREPAGQPDQVARDLHLRQITVENVNGDHAIRLILRRSGGESIVHQIFSPSHVRLNMTDDGRGEELEIQGANAATIVRFHSGADHHL